MQVATGTLKAFLPEIGKPVNFGTAHGGPSDLINNSIQSGFALEAIFTFFLVTCNLYDCSSQESISWMHGFTIGGMVFLLHLVGVPLTGASMNPERFGPTLMSDAGFGKFIGCIG